jgi:hypothetical protein
MFGLSRRPMAPTLPLDWQGPRHVPLATRGYTILLFGVGERVRRDPLRVTDIGWWAMHLQNRVTPFGDIVAIPQRGTFTGNRGIIHDPMTRTLLTKRWASKAWLVCSCEYKGRRREVMGRRSWTELFFLDEAVALAAGHRPCFRCRREAAEAFRAAWMGYVRYFV